MRSRTRTVKVESWIRVSIEVKSSIRIRIKVMWIRNPAYNPNVVNLRIICNYSLLRITYSR